CSGARWGLRASWSAIPCGCGPSPTSWVPARLPCRRCWRGGIWSWLSVPPRSNGERPGRRARRPPAGASRQRGSARPPNASWRAGPIVLPLADSAPGGPVTRERILAVTAAALKRGPTVVVATAAPYALAHVPQECAALAVYGADPSTLQAAAAVLSGAIRPGG